MQVEELYDLTSWVEVEVVGKQLVQKFQQLHKVLNQNAQANQQKQPFESQQETLVDALRRVPLDQLSIGQVNTLEDLKIAPNVGDQGASLVEDVLFKNALDVANAAQQIKRCVAELNEGIQWSNQLRELLEKIINSESISEIDDKVLLRVHFAGEAHIDNLTELKDWSKVWWEIGRGISMAHDQAPDSIEVIGASKGSIIVSLLTAQAIAGTVSGIIFAALKVVEKYYDIKRKAQEVRALEIGNDKAEKALEDAAKKHREDGVAAIVEQTVKELGLNPKTEGDKVNELTSATKKLVDFVSKGGEVDFVVPDDEEDDDEFDGDNTTARARADLRVRFQEVRKLEKEVKRLEDRRP